MVNPAIRFSNTRQYTTILIDSVVAIGEYCTIMELAVI